MPADLICKLCEVKCKKKQCAAVSKLIAIHQSQRIEEKTILIKALREELNLIDYEPADDLKELGEQVINAVPDLNFIKLYKIRIGYVRSYEAKKDKSKKVNAECMIVKGAHTAYLPYDFIITFYEPNMYYMTQNQRQLLMQHELSHIGIGTQGFKIEDHDVQDFEDIITEHGIRWSDPGKEISDILNSK